ncbi:MAG: hypothetical protein QXG39_00125 [Candidatus Aenigmatarchaeota archaeon]
MTMVKCVYCGNVYHIGEDVWKFTFEDVGVDEPLREVGLCKECFMGRFVMKYSKLLGKFEREEFRKFVKLCKVR